jgi:hypothetical protein
MDAGTYDLSGTKIMTIYPEHRRSLPSMATRHTVHPEHRRSLPSMATRHTVHPEHKKQPVGCFFIFIHLIN